MKNSFLKLIINQIRLKNLELVLMINQLPLFAYEI